MLVRWRTGTASPCDLARPVFRYAGALCHKSFDAVPPGMASAFAGANHHDRNRSCQWTGREELRGSTRDSFDPYSHRNASQAVPTTEPEARNPPIPYV